MEIRFFKSLPEHQGPAVQPPDPSTYPVSVVCLERDADPDANNHTGYDYWGVYGGSLEGIIAWENKNSGVVTHIEYSDLPGPVTFYPEPFSNVTRNSSDGSVTYYIRSRDEQGRFIADDPSTPDVNEAWVPVTNN